MTAHITGLAVFTRMLFRGQDISAVWEDRLARFVADDTDAGSAFDMSMMLQLTGQRDKGLELQEVALGTTQIYTRIFGDGSGPHVLAIFAPGDFMANTPLDFLLEGSNFTVYYAYVSADGELPLMLPQHDVAFFGIGESSVNQTILKGLRTSAAAWPSPSVNASLDRIAALSRDGVWEACRRLPMVCAPPVRRFSRQDLVALSTGEKLLDEVLSGAILPLLARPLDSHAGQALEKIDDLQSLANYLSCQLDDDFYLSQFVDYSNADGLFRKQRIAFIDGEPFASHMAISDHWMVHYLSAGMDERAERREEEAEFMATFETGFATRHREAFASLHGAFGLDYFAIDCAELPDGRLLLFEADVAMIVHSLDSEERYPYKKAPMQRLTDRFKSHLTSIANRGALRGQAFAAPQIAGGQEAVAALCRG